MKKYTCYLIVKEFFWIIVDGGAITPPSFEKLLNQAKGHHNNQMYTRIETCKKIAVVRGNTKDECVNKAWDAVFVSNTGSNEVALHFVENY